MTPEEIRAVVIAALRRVAPEIDAAAIDPDAPFRRAYDVDSMDYLNFIIALHAKLGVTVPEQDYGQVTTVNGAVAYLLARLNTATPGAR
jgi:acyl carrier protein